MARLASIAPLAGAVMLLGACADGPARFVAPTDAEVDVLVPRTDGGADIVTVDVAPVDRPAVRTVRTVIGGHGR